MTEGFAAPPTVGEAGTRPDRPAPREPRPVPRRRRRRLPWIVGGAVVLTVVGGIIADSVLEAHANAMAPAERGDTGRVSSMALVEGLCLADVPAIDEAPGTVTAVSCDDPHLAETVATYRFDGDAWPGEEQVAADATAFCKRNVGRIVPEDLAPELSWRVWAPSEHTWAQGDREAVCLVVATAPLTGSLEAGTATPAGARG